MVGPDALAVAMLGGRIEAELHSVVAEPARGLERLVDGHADQGRIAPSFGQPDDVVVVRIRVVGLHHERLVVRFGERRNQLVHGVEPVERDSIEAAGEPGVAAAELEGRLLQHENGGARPRARRCRRERGIAGADDDDVVLGRDASQLTDLPNSSTIWIDLSTYSPIFRPGCQRRSPRSSQRRRARSHGGARGARRRVSLRPAAPEHVQRARALPARLARRDARGRAGAHGRMVQSVALDEGGRPSSTWSGRLAGSGRRAPRSRTARRGTRSTTTTATSGWSVIHRRRSWRPP